MQYFTSFVTILFCLFCYAMNMMHSLKIFDKNKDQLKSFHLATVILSFTFFVIWLILFRFEPPKTQIAWFFSIFFVFTIIYSIDMAITEKHRKIFITIQYIAPIVHAISFYLTRKYDKSLRIVERKNRKTKSFTLRPDEKNWLKKQKLNNPNQSFLNVSEDIALNLSNISAIPNVDDIDQKQFNLPAQLQTPLTPQQFDDLVNDKEKGLSFMHLSPNFKRQIIQKRQQNREESEQQLNATGVDIPRIVTLSEDPNQNLQIIMSGQPFPIVWQTQFKCKSPSKKVFYIEAPLIYRLANKPCAKCGSSMIKLLMMDGEKWIYCLKKKCKVWSKASPIPIVDRVIVNNVADCNFQFLQTKHPNAQKYKTELSRLPKNIGSSKVITLAKLPTINPNQIIIDQKQLPKIGYCGSFEEKKKNEDNI